MAGAKKTAPREIQRSKFRRAFTLVEIMVALAIFTLVIGAVYATFVSVMRASKVGLDAAAQAQRQRIALRTIEDSLMCAQSFQASQRYYSFIVANGEAPVLSFASRLPEVFPRNGKFSDFNLRRLTFALEAGTDGEKNLVLRQNPILMPMDEDEQKYPLVLARNVKTFIIECWDTNQLDWVNEWDDTNSIPPMLRVGLVMGGNTTLGGAAPDYSVVRAFSMPSGMMPAIVQMGGAGVGNPGGGINLAPPGANAVGARGRPAR
jgi:prepilin-type N-terminal cleavage/methylation domain-containing protein